MKLVIAEKKELGQNIASAVCGAPKACRLPYEGNGFRVVNCVGHMLGLVEPSDYDPDRYRDRKDLSVLPILLEPWPKVPDESKRGLLDEIGRGLAECDSVIHAGDPDDEGQLLVDEVLDYFGYDGRVERVLINDNLERNIRKAFERLSDNREHMQDGMAAEARAIADFCFGINESRLIAAKAGHGVPLSVGRVQTPTLGMVVRRDEEIMGHAEREYYTGYADLIVDSALPALRFAFKPAKELVDPETKKVMSRMAVSGALESIEGGSGDLETTVEEVAYKAPLPYNLVDLMADMGNRYKMGAQQVQDATQVLRDRYQAITYNRSDCNYLPLEAHKEASSTLSRAMGNIGADWELDFSIRGRCFSDENVTAHTGIIPQDIDVDISSMSVTERKVYCAIVERYALQFMPDARALISISTVEVACGRLEHRAKLETVRGWKAIRDVADPDDKATQGGFIEVGRHFWEWSGGMVESKKTKPRPPYTETSLAKDMSSIAKYVEDTEVRATLKRKDEGKRGEHGGIGTPATRAAIIERLKDKGYLEVRKGKLISTALGRQVYHACPKEIRGADLTARWWLICEEVREGKTDSYAVARSVCEEFERHRDTAYTDVMITRRTIAEPIAVCPRCGKPVIDPGPNQAKYSCSSNEWKNFGDRESKDYRLVSGCGFELWKTQFGKRLTEKQARDLIEKGSTGPVAGLRKRDGGTFSAKLALDPKTLKVTLTGYHGKARR